MLSTNTRIVAKIKRRRAGDGQEKGRSVLVTILLWCSNKQVRTSSRVRYWRFLCTYAHIIIFLGVRCQRYELLPSKAFNFWTFSSTNLASTVSRYIFGWAPHIYCGPRTRLVVIAPHFMREKLNRGALAFSIGMGLFLTGFDKFFLSVAIRKRNSSFERQEGV